MAVAEPDSRRPSGLRKLHSLSGVVPVGAFVLLHVWQSLSIVGSRETYDRQIGFLHGGALLGLLEAVLVLLPLGYHAVYGVYRSLQPRTSDHAYESAMMQALQRVSGAVVLVFVVAHVCEFRAQTWTSGLGVASYSTKLIADLSSTQAGVPFYALGYLVGFAACFFHLANGMTSFCTMWGLAPDEGSRRRTRLFFRITCGLFFVLSAAIVLQVATGSRFFPASPPSSQAMLCGSAVPPPPPPLAPASSSSALPSPSH